VTTQETGQAAASVTGGPVPLRERWQPLRTGLVDLFYYDDQEFWFRDGRLMLRGNNGTGKSKVLALTLPFLLDADLSPTRVEPDGDRDKKMDWNLLLGGRYDERLGYAWLEFGRRTEDGEHAYFTIGCGLKAVAGRGIADRWYFVTSQRVGADLFLIGSGGSALTRDRLVAAVGEYGQVTQKAQTYRRAVDEHLFRLGPDRYAALVDLLVQLRQPQLSRRPDEGKLSRALSEALTPLDQSVLADIATAFHDLEQQRDELAGLRDTRGHVVKFLLRYQHYARVAARRQGRELRSAQASYEQAGRDLGGVREQIGRAQQAEAEAASRLETVTGELAGLSAAREELAGRPELASLEHAERLAETTARGAAAEHQKAGRAERLRGERAARHVTARTAADRTREQVTRRAADTAGSAADGGIGPEHAELYAPLDLPDGISEQLIRQAEQQAAALAQRRAAAAAHVLALAETAQSAEAAAMAARTRLGELEAEHDAAAEARDAADRAVTEAGAALVAAWQAYAAGVSELAVPQPDETGLAAWTVSLDGPNPAETALRAVALRTAQTLADARAQAAVRADEAAAALAALAGERLRLESGETARPPVPHTRADGVRDGRPGAPLWQLTDFADGLGDADRAGLEAALEASGLLDAWVTPDGRLLEAGTHDVVLSAGAAPSAGRSLAELLRPAADPGDAQASAVAPGTVAAVLACIGLRAPAAGSGMPGHPGRDLTADPAGDRPVDPPVDPAGEPAACAGTDGRWRVGPLHGSWAKPAAEYVGAGSREQARRRRLAVLAEEISLAERAVEAAARVVSHIEARQTALAGEQSRQPSDQELRDAHGTAAGAARQLAQAADKVTAQRGRVAHAEGKAAGAARERDEAAADLGVPATMAGLRAVSEAVIAYSAAAQGLAGLLWQHLAKLSDVATWAEELDRAEQDLAAARAAAAEAEAEARDTAARLAALRAAIGATADELRQRLAAVRKRIAELSGEQKTLDSRHREVTQQRARLQGREEQLQANMAAEARRRDAAVAAFQRFAATGLLAVAAADLELPDTGPAGQPWAADPAVRLARRAEQALTAVDDSDEAWKRIQDDIGRRHAELAEALSRHGHHAVMSLEDERVVVTIQFQGRERTPGELTELLDDEVAYRERMLTAKERELIEEHLVNDVASHLQELISDAEAQVEGMNAELAERPTSTGMRLRLRWEPLRDGPEGLAEARRRLLRQDAELWSPADRAAVGEFLHRQIEAQRGRDENGTWQEHLRRALDYRGWHRFVIERYQDGRWRPATGPASGGERVLTVSLPLFAAASAHYRSAHPHAPRIVLLDEAFAGVDDDSRAKCLGLLATFDLDVAMTSEREWGFYATVPGIATHQLVRRDGIDAVHVTTWEWDGRAHRRVERLPAGRAREPERAPSDGSANGSSGERRGPDAGSSLW